MFSLGFCAFLALCPRRYLDENEINGRGEGRGKEREETLAANFMILNEISDWRGTFD